MAHMIDLAVDCVTCGGAATQEVFNHRSASVGRYCWKHAQQKLAELEREEARR